MEELGLKGKWELLWAINVFLHLFLLLNCLDAILTSIKFQTKHIYYKACSVKWKKKDEFGFWKNSSLLILCWFRPIICCSTNIFKRVIGFLLRELWIEHPGKWKDHEWFHRWSNKCAQFSGKYGTQSASVIKFTELLQEFVDGTMFTVQFSPTPLRIILEIQRYWCVQIKWNQPHKRRTTFII